MHLAATGANAIALHMRSFFLILWLTGVPIAFLAKNTSAAQQSPLFEDTSLLTVELDIPISRVNAGKKQRVPKQYSGQLHWFEQNGVRRTISVKVRARGNFRKENCANPPLRLNLKKQEVENTLFTGQDKLKLVRPCDNRKRSEQWAALEYLIYQSYQTLTREGFHTRPLLVRYIGGKNNQPTAGQFAFLIEDEDAMATRNGGNILETRRINRRALDTTSLARLELFQFLIGNNDYSTIRAERGRRCCHNIRLITNEEGLGLRPVPYDFDFAGMVDASYATPPPSVRIRSVKTRYFRGFCQQPSELNRAIAQFNDSRTALYQHYSETEVLTTQSKEKARAYLDSFFEIINDPKQLDAKVKSRCR